MLLTRFKMVEASFKLYKLKGNNGYCRLGKHVSKKIIFVKNDLTFQGLFTFCERSGKTQRNYPMNFEIISFTGWLRDRLTCAMCTELIHPIHLDSLRTAIKFLFILPCQLFFCFIQLCTYWRHAKQRLWRVL